MLASNNFNISDFKVFPTVFNNFESLTIQNSKILIDKVTIYSITGQVVKAFTFSNKNDVRIPLDKLSTGIYFMHINNEKANVHTFIVK
jgi:hypothetical protein